MSAAPVAEASAAPADNGEPVQLQFEEEAEQGLGPDAAVPDPPSSPWVRRKKRQTAVPEQAKASDALAAKGTGGPGTCLLCQKKCYNKSKFCNDHTKDAEACRRDAESSGQIAFFNEQCNSTELLRKMLVEYIAKCASKGPGVKRDRFDWVQYQEKLCSGKEVRKGSKDRPLCYQQWMKHAQEQEFKSWQLVFNLNTSHVVFSTEHVVKGVDWVLPRQEAHADWQRFEADEDVQRDQLGPQASPLRLYCPVEDYVIHEDVSGYRRQRVAATKSKSKPQDKDIKAMDESLQGSMPKWNDERFNIGDFHSGTANPYLTQGGHAATVSRVVQDVPTLSGSGRSEGTPGPSPQSGTAPVKPSKDIAKQKTKKYDEALNSLQKEQRNWLQVLNKSQATIEEFLKDNERADYEHFLCLAETRLLAMQWLLKDDMTREALDKKWGLLQDEQRLYLPCDTALLRLPSEIMTKVKHILLANNVEDLHSKKDLATADITQISQLSRGLSGSAQDLTKAKERRVKEAENQEAREKRKQELKDTKAAKKSKLQHQKNAAQERQDAKLDPHRVDKLDVSCFRGVAVLKSVEDTEKVDGLLPFVVRAAGKLSAQLYDSITNLKFVQAMKNFQAAYRTTTATKATGRAQCDCSPAELQAHLRGGMRFFAKYNTSAVTDIGPSGNNVSMWGNVENMNFVATEFESVGQLRFLLKGRKQTMCAPATAVLDAMGKLHLKTDNQDALFRFMRNLTQKQKDDSGLVVYIADCIEGDISYMPCGWIMADFCGDSEAIGLRVAAISSKDCVSGNVEALAKIPGTSSRHRDNTMKFLQAAKEL